MVKGKVHPIFDKKRVSSFAKENVQDVVLKATIRYYRQWLSFDGVWLEYVKSKGLSEHAFDSIVREYGVARCLPKKSDGESNILKTLNDAADVWPKSLLERHKKCEDLASPGNKYFVSRKSKNSEGPKEIFAGSFVTKLMWFIRPDEWTVFDGFAANGLACTKPDAKEKMRQFYQTLQDNSFIDLVYEMQSKISNTSFREMHAPRIVDLVLMIKGKYLENEDMAETNRIFLSLLPQQIADELSELSSVLNEKFGHRTLFKA